MNNKAKNAIKVIAYAIEKDTQSLIKLLRKNGVFVENKISKDELQSIVVTSLAKSKSFQKEFKNWVIERATNSKYANFDALPASVGYSFGSVASSSLPTSNTQQTFLNSNLDLDSINPTQSDLKPESPWKLSINEILDFAKTGMNNFVLIQQSKTDREVANAALEAKRLELQTTPVPTGVKKIDKSILVITGVIAFAAIVAGVVYMKKMKK
jgi:hypothetical protein